MNTKKGIKKLSTVENKRLNAIPDRKKLHQAYEDNYAIYDLELRRLNKRLKRLLTENQINATIKTRLKSFESYFNKLLRLYTDHEADKAILTDFIGIRIITGRFF